MNIGVFKLYEILIQQYTFNYYSVYIFFFVRNCMQVFVLKNFMRHLQTNDVISGSAVRSASCLFFGVNGLTDDKTESNDICH